MNDAAPADTSAPRTEAPPSIRVVVVTWEGAHLIQPCLDALLAQSVGRDDMEIFVVDNASTDGTEGLILGEYPQVHLRRSTSNLGFAGGADLGLEGFDGDYVAFVNNDATLAPDAIARMRDALERPGSERVAAVTAKIALAGKYRPASDDERDTRGALTDGRRWFVPAGPDSAIGLRLLNSTGNVVRRNGAGGDRGWLTVDSDSVPAPDVFGFCGGAALIRRTALDEVGPFDPDLFLYYEDTDLSWRLRSHGWQIRYVPEAHAEHLHAASSDPSSALFRYYNTRNSLIVFTRHAPAHIVLRSFARQLGGYVRAMAGDSSSEVTRATGRALVAFIRALPGALTDRRRLWRDSTVSRRVVAQYLV